MTAFDPLRSDAPLIAYFDFKSPYAFAAWEPTWTLQEQLGIEIDWRPLTLDIPSYLGSATRDETRDVAPGERVPNERTSGQWNQVRYAYHDARRYVALTGKVLRGTTKIWDSSLAAIGMLWVKREGQEPLRRYGDLLFERFWRREIDIEEPLEIARLITSAGISAAGFQEYLRGEGRAAHDATQRQIFDAGIFGVPTYLCAGEQLFGREHLPRIHWLLGGRMGPAPDVAYRRFSRGRDEGVTGTEVAAPALDTFGAMRIWIDITDPWCYLAWRPTCALLDELGVQAEWQPAISRPMRPRPPAPEAAPRGERHRAFRSSYRLDELTRYAEALNLPAADLTRRADPTLAGITIAWCQRETPERLRPLLDALFIGYWEGSLDVTSREALRAVLVTTGAPVEGFQQFTMHEGPAALDRSLQALAEVGVSTLPLYLLDDEPFAGRAHLPMMRWLMGGRRGPGPI